VNEITTTVPTTAARLSSAPEQNEIPINMPCPLPTVALLTLNPQQPTGAIAAAMPLATHAAATTFPPAVQIVSATPQNSQDAAAIAVPILNSYRLSLQATESVTPDISVVTPVVNMTDSNQECHSWFHSPNSMVSPMVTRAQSRGQTPQPETANRSCSQKRKASPTDAMTKCCWGDE